MSRRVRLAQTSDPEGEGASRVGWDTRRVCGHRFIDCNIVVSPATIIDLGSSAYFATLCYARYMQVRETHTRRAVENIMRLRRLRRDVNAGARNDVDSVLSYLEDMVGPTLSRAETARLLGMSHTALDNWIGKGDIPVVLTPSGRREVPLAEVVELLEALAGSERRSVADVIRERRRDAEAIPEELFLPPRRRRPRTHRVPELQALAYHRLVAQRLDEHLVSDARRRLERWERSGRIDPRWAAEWHTILEKPTDEVRRVITADSERGRALRQSSPFPGSLNQHERQRVARAVEERVAG